MKYKSRYVYVGALLILLSVPIVIFWGSINALLKDVTNQPCSIADLEYKPSFIIPPGIPLIFNKPQYERVRKCKPISIFFKENVNEEQITTFLDQLKYNPNIYYVDYVSKKKAIENYKEQIKNQPVFLEIMPQGEFLPASAELYINYPQNKNQIISDMKLNQIVGEVIVP